MNKIEYNGKVVLDIDAVKQAVTDTNTNTASIQTLNNTKVSSETVKSIVICTDYPQTEVNGVLYIKVES